MTKTFFAVVIVGIVLVFACLLVNRQKPGTSSKNTLTTDTDISSPTPDVSNPTLTSTASLVALNTPKGQIVIELFPDKAPNTVKNFLAKVTSGFYTNLTFHRVEDWVVQGGDPEGTGRGGGEQATELSDLPFTVGSVGVARGPDIAVSNASQFFICTKDCSWLTGEYTLFGRVVSGLEVAKMLVEQDKITSITQQTK